MWLFFTWWVGRKKGSERDRRRHCLSFQGHWDNHSYPFHLFVPFLCHSSSVGKICCVNVQYEHFYVCAINIFLSMFTFNHIMYFIRARDYKTTFFPSDLHWNTSISFQCCTVHVVHSYTDVREQKTLPSAAAVLSLGPHLNSFLAWGSSWETWISNIKKHETKIL